MKRDAKELSEAIETLMIAWDEEDDFDAWLKEGLE